MKTLGLFIVLILSSSIGDILSARAMCQIGDVRFTLRGVLRAVRLGIRNPCLFLGIVCQAIAFGSFLGLLSFVDLSYVVPLTAVTYLINTVGSRFVLKERISRERWIGTLLVACGVVLVSLSGVFEDLIVRRAAEVATLLGAPVGGTLQPHVAVLLWLAVAMRLGLLFLVISAMGFYLIAVWAGWQWYRERLRQRRLGFGYHPAISIMVPVRGADGDTYSNFSRLCQQDYPSYEIIFGACDDLDPAVSLIRQLKSDFPSCPIELVVSPATIGANGKVSNLQNMYAQARFEMLLIIDSDIRVGPDYLARVVAPMKDMEAGMVTCLYRGAGPRTPAGLFEELGHSAIFGPEVVAARALEGIKFALGSTMLVRRKTLDEIGGFPALADYLADDFLLGNSVAAAGLEVVLSDYIVEHVTGPITVREMLRHLLRWGRSTRISRPWGYRGLILTYGTATSLLLLLALKFSMFGWIVLILTLVIRLLPVLAIGVLGLKDRRLLKYLWLVPIRDLITFCVWVASFVGDEIDWRGSRFRVLPSGKITPIARS
jgi:ceramide glucosyltransferase